MLHGLINLSIRNYYSTPVLGGEAGSAFPFGAVLVFQLRALNTTGGNPMLLGRTSGSDRGWAFYLTTANALRFYCRNGADTVIVGSTGFTFVASDVGKFFVAVGYWDGTHLRLALGRDHTTAPVASAGYTTSSSPTSAGSLGIGTAASMCALCSWATFTGTPTDLPKYFDTVRALRGELPTSMLDSLVTYGLKSWSTANFLATGAGLGLQGSTSGFFGFASVRFDVLPSGSGQAAMIVHTNPASGINGWNISTFQQNLRFVVLDGSTPYLAMYTVQPADVGVPLLIGWQFTGTHLQLFIRRVQTSTSIYGVFVVSGQPMLIGTRSDGHPFPSTVFGVMGGNAQMTVAEMQKVFDDFEQTGRLVPIPGKTEHRWEISEDAAEDSAVPAQILDRVPGGTDHLTRTGAPTWTAAGAVLRHRWSAREALVGVPNPAGRTAYGVRNINATTGLQTAPAAGLAGSTACYGAMIATFHAVPNGASLVWRAAGSTGWVIDGFASALRFTFQGSPTVVSLSVAVPDLGVPSLVAWRHDGSFLTVWQKGVQVGSVAISGFIASPAAMKIGLAGTANWDFYALGGANAALSNAEMAQLFTDFENTGRLVLPAGKPDTKLWEVTQDVVASGNLRAVPAAVNDRVTTDHLVRSGPSIAALNAVRGVGGYTLTDYYVSVVGGGIPGAVTGFHVHFDVVFTVVPSVAEQLVNMTTSNAGMGWYFSVTASGLSVQVGTPDGWVVPATFALNGTHLNTRLRVLLQKTPTVTQFYVNGVQVGSDVPSVSFNPATTGRLGVGGVHGLGAQPFVSGRIENVQGGHTLLTPAEIVTLNADRTQPPPVIAGKSTKRWVLETDIAAAAGSVPRTVLEQQSGTDHLTLLGGLEVVRYVEAGPPAPIAIADSVTGAAADTMARVGLPAVTIIDPSIDGRLTKGLSGFSAENYLEAAPGKGIVGSASALTVQALLIPSSTAVAAYVAGTTSNSGTFLGWHLDVYGSRISFAIANAAGTTIALTITGLSISGPVVVTGTWDGTNIRAYLNDALIGTVGVTGYTIATVGMRVGIRPYNTTGPFSGQLFQLQGGDIVASLTDVQDSYANWLRTGKLALPGAQHDYDFTADIDANGGAALGVPATALDRIGFDHLARVDTRHLQGAVKGLRLVGAGVSQLRLPTGVGIYGTATALTVSCLITPLALITTGVVASTWVSGSGWYFVRFGTAGTAAALAFALNNVQTTTGALTADELNTIIHVAFTYDGTTLRTYVNGAERHSAAVAAYQPSTEPLTIGNHPVATSTPAPNDTIFYAIGGGAYVATPAEIAAQSLASRATGRLAEIPSRLDERRYNFDHDAVEQGIDLPSLLTDRAQGGMKMARVGAPLQVAQRVERVFSYEASPVIEGATGFTPTDRFEQANGFGGHAVTFFWQLFLRFDTQTVPSRTRMLISNYVGAADGGFMLYSYGTHNSLQAVFINAAGGSVAMSTIPLTSNDIGKGFLVTAQVDIGTILSASAVQTARLWARRAQIGTGVQIAGMRPRVGGTLLLGEGNAGGASEGITIFGMQYGLGSLTPAEIYANHDATMAANDIQAFPGRTTGLFSLPRSIRENAGLMPSTLIDRVGSAHMTRVGNLTVSPQYAHSYTW